MCRLRSRKAREALERIGDLQSPPNQRANASQNDDSRESDNQGPVGTLKFHGPAIEIGHFLINPSQYGRVECSRNILARGSAIAARRII